ncbi:MAG: bacteriophage holin [Kiloniellaceae bacterium]
MREYSRLDVLSFALAFGIAMAALVFLVGIVTWITGFWGGAVDITAKVYIGYAPTLLGSIIGGLWGFVEGFIFGALLAWLYNVVRRTIRRGEAALETRES